MRTLIPYFTIKGRTAQALDFYAACFGGKATYIQRFAQTTYTYTPAWADKIAHAEFVAPGIRFFLSDGFEQEDAVLGKDLGIGMTIDFDDADEHMATYEALKQHGTVTFDFFDTTIGTRLVCVLDQFNIHWYLNLLPASTQR
jgi:PhnB protein